MYKYEHIENGNKYYFWFELEGQNIEINTQANDVTELGQGFSITEIGNPEKIAPYIKDSCDYRSDFPNLSIEICKIIASDLLKNSSFNYKFCRIETIAVTGRIINYQMHDYIDDLWDEVISWDLPDNYNVDVYATEDDLKNFFDDVDVKFTFEGKFSYPITVYSGPEGICEALKNPESVDENYCYSYSDCKPTQKHRDFLWETHFGNCQKADIVTYSYPK